MKNNYRYIKSVMNKNVVTLPESASVSSAAKLMTMKNISCIVITKGKKPAGLITERDMIKRVMSKKIDPLKTEIGKVMSKRLVTIFPESNLVPTVELMKQKKIRRVVVVNANGSLAGIITETDLLRGIIKLVKHLDWKLVTMKITAREYIEKLKESSLDKGII